MSPTLARASLTTALAGTNNDITYQSRMMGTEGNSTRIRYVAGADPSATDVTISGQDITVTYGQHEVQTVTITGAPTGGTFTLTFNGQTTAAIPYNATAAQVQAALEALSTVAGGGQGSEAESLPAVVVTGGPGPGTPWSVEFIAEKDADANVPAMTATGSFTGGTTPAVAVAAGTSVAATAAEVAARVNAEASALVHAYLAAGNDGTGRVAALAYTNLSGGLA